VKEGSPQLKSPTSAMIFIGIKILFGGTLDSNPSHAIVMNKRSTMWAKPQLAVLYADFVRYLYKNE